MAIDITKGSHKVAFMSKIAAAENGTPHIYNVTLAADHDNGELVVRNTESWNSFDNYDENEDGEITFTGVIRGLGANGGYYVEVLTASAAQEASGTAYPEDLCLVYNSPVSEYAERDLQDESLFYNEEGDVVQGINLIRGDIIELSSDAFTGTIATDASVSYDASTKKYVIA